MKKLTTFVIAIVLAGCNTTAPRKEPVTGKPDAVTCEVQPVSQTYSTVICRTRLPGEW